MIDFLSIFEKISWLDVYLCENVELAVKIFSEKIVNVLDQFAPVRTIQSRTKYVPWLSIETKNLMNERNNAKMKQQQVRII